MLNTAQKVAKFTVAKHISGDQIKKDDMGGACDKYGGKRNGYKYLVGNPEGKTPLGSFRRRR